MQTVMVRSIVLATLLLSCGSRMNARAKLGFYEAQLLVEHTPAFLHAVGTGDCPQTSDGLLDGDLATFVVRGGCKQMRWIATFYVDITTGKITVDHSSGPVTIESDELVELRKSLFARRSQVRLVASDASCLMRTAAVFAVPDSCVRVTI